MLRCNWKDRFKFKLYEELCWPTMAPDDKKPHGERGTPAEEKIFETMKFLLNSVTKLSDVFVESNGKFKQDFVDISSSIAELRQRLDWLERVLEERAAVAAESAGDSGDGGKSAHEFRRTSTEEQLPVVRGTEDFRVPALNLSADAIVDIYANNPILLEPFSRPCSFTARSLNGEINHVELEVFSQGSNWVLECKPAGWLLIPRPGSLERKTSLEFLERLYVIEGVSQLPVLLYLIRPALLDAVEVGRRWQLREKGKIDVSPDPVRVALSERMAHFEKRLALLESKQGD